MANSRECFDNENAISTMKTNDSTWITFNEPKYKHKKVNHRTNIKN